MSWFTLDASEFERLQDAMLQYEGAAGNVIDGVLHDQGAELVKNRIAMLLPSSGRNWRGKGAAASSAMPARFSQDNGSLSVTIAARGKYHYLYFPDDGSNTKKHAGNQQFMMHGAENASPDIIDLCIGKLIDEF